MSTFGGLISEIRGISIDRFDGENLKSPIFFLSHCHEDHMRGLNQDLLNHAKSDLCIYMSPVSKAILQYRSPELMKFVKPLPVDEPCLIAVPRGTRNNEKDCIYVNVTLISAGHCPGSVMFLFERADGMRILYTGDFRMSLSMVKKLNHLHDRNGEPKTIHKMYFDSSFWNENIQFPERTKSSEYVYSIIKEWISKGKNYLILLSLPARYGTEFLYSEIYHRLKMPIHVNDHAYKVYSLIPDLKLVTTNDSTKTQIHSCSDKFVIKWHINCRSDAKNLKIRYIRPSAMYFKMRNLGNEIFKENDNNFFNVFYSSHCSHEELQEFLSYLKPKLIEPCVVPRDNICEFFDTLNEFSKAFVEAPIVYSEENHEFGEEEQSQTVEQTVENKTSLLDELSDSEDDLSNSQNQNGRKLYLRKSQRLTVSKKKIKLF